MSARGLGAAVASLAATAALPVTVETTVDERLPAPIEAALYFAAAEALANATKHARCRGVTLTIRRGRLDVVLTVTDDGCGGADPNGTGLTGSSNASRPSTGAWTCPAPSRTHHPSSGGSVRVVIVSQYVEVTYASELLSNGSRGGLGYLLKDRIGDIDQFVDSVRTVANGGMAIDPEVVAQLLPGSGGEAHRQHLHQAPAPRRRRRAHRRVLAVLQWINRT